MIQLNYLIKWVISPTRDGKLIRAGTQNIESTFTKKLKCGCGATMQKFSWHVYKNGKKSYGYMKE